MRTLLKIIRDNIVYRKQILELAKADKKKAYKGSDLGVIWAFVRPTMYVCVFYAAITLGFRGARHVQDICTPYFIWLITGMMAWFYMSSMLGNGAGSFRKYKSYVKATKLPITIIPSIIAISNLMVHAICISGTLLLAIFAFGVKPSIYWLEILFYMPLMVIFAIIWSIATGMIAALNKDFHNFLNTITQALFWLSAIIFDINSVESETVQRVFMFNPITFIVEGYRNAVCKHIWFWEQPDKLMCYLISMGVMLLLAILSYKRFSKVIPDYL